MLKPSRPRPKFSPFGRQSMLPDCVRQRGPAGDVHAASPIVLESCSDDSEPFAAASPPLRHGHGVRYCRGVENDGSIVMSPGENCSSREDAALEQGFDFFHQFTNRIH